MMDISEFTQMVQSVMKKQVLVFGTLMVIISGPSLERSQEEWRMILASLQQKLQLSIEP